MEVVEVQSDGRDRERSRRAILAAAMKHFARHGFSGARVDRIAQEAGVNKRLIYYYFESKEGLHLQVLDNAYAEMNAKEEEEEAGESSPDLQLRHLLSSFLRFLGENRTLLELVSADLRKGSINSRARKSILYTEIERVVTARNSMDKLPVDPDALYVSTVELAGLGLLAEKASEACAYRRRLMLAADFLIAAAT